MRALLLAAVLLAACRTSGDDVHLSGAAGEMFRRITGARGMTLNERTAIYGSEEPASDVLICHEEAHKRHARVIADALVEIGAIDDDIESRTAAWVSVYAIEYLQRGYTGNRYELEAKKVCGQQ